MNRKEIITTAVIGATLTATTLAGFAGWYITERRNAGLKTELAELRRQERISAVKQSVSRQMEEIAYEQKEISDEQREEALLQTKIANELKERSEEERHNAIIAQQAALASERKALDAFDQAEQQRLMAEHQRIQAELAKRTADTLNFITLGRSLGTLALKHYYSGSQDLCRLLSYASYYFTNQYKGDLYDPSVYQALTLASQSTSVYSEHEGAVMNIDVLDDNKRLVSVSSYGEILMHAKKDGKLETKALLRDKNYDFRDVWVNDKGTIYALSRTGHLYIKTPKETKILELTGMTHPLKLTKLGDKTLVVAEDAVALFNYETNQIEATKKLNFKVTCTSTHDGIPILFDDRGRMHYVKGFDEMTTKKVPVLGTVTDYAVSSSMNFQVFGMKDGTVFFINKNGQIRRLLGHRSRISKIKITGKRVFTSSFDGTLNLWISDSERPEPIELCRGNNWIMHFAFDKTKENIWLGDQKGNIVKAAISVPLMADMIQRNLKRNMSAEEWNYYIGKNIPYKLFIR